ncbi:MAG: glycosyltransferase family 39 protein [Patescibacteria group bacterium]|nr:glycosyltransferase family 39 protein [Patescibacteria group bacterium]
MGRIKIEFVILFFIVFLGFILRIYGLSNIPSGFFYDEASIGYNAYSLLNTGKDEYGISSPIFFRSFGDYRPPLATYLTIPFIFIFGLNETSVRLPSVFCGLITIILMYFLGKEIRSKRFGLLIAFITATMPWLIHYNRTGFEFTIYNTFFIATIFLLIKATRHKFFVIPAFILAALTLYTYQPARLLIPFLLIGVLLIYRKAYFLHKKETIAGLLLFFILSIPLILSFFNGEGIARFNMVSVFSAKLSFTQTILRIIQNYLAQLSPSYFMIGEPTFITRHFTGGLTPLLKITLPFLFVGLISTFLTINKKISQLLIYWLFIYPIAGTVTANAPFTSRSIIGAPLFAIFIGLGITILTQYGKRFINSFALVTMIVSIISINLIFFTKFYFIQYPLYSSDFWGWQYGPKPIMQYFIKNKNQYDNMFIMGNFNSPNIFVKFYDPENKCESKCLIGDLKSFDQNKHQLFAIGYDRISEIHGFDFNIKKTINYPNGRPAFYIGVIKK